MSAPYQDEPPKETIDHLHGAAVLEFGTNWCGYCQSAQPFIESAFADRGDIQHIKVEDGKGRPLGRSFRVKQWPTLIFLRDGAEVARVVRPSSTEVLTQAFEQLRAV
jgi:thioredoxin 1